MYEAHIPPMKVTGTRIYVNSREHTSTLTDVLFFRTEGEHLQCVYLTIGPRNTAVRNKNVGMGIKDIPGYQWLNPPPISV
jgi:hypothetical protein